MIQVFRFPCRGGRLCPPAENADFTKNHWKFDTFQRAGRVVGPYKKAACFTLLCENQASLPHSKALRPQPERFCYFCKYAFKKRMASR